MGSVPTGNFTGNGRDAIAISGSGGVVFVSQTLYDRGVPYHVGSGQDGGRMMDVRLQHCIETRASQQVKRLAPS